MFLNIVLGLILVINVAAYEKNFNSCNDFKLPNGKMRMKPRGKLAKFQCNKGYMLAGEKYSYCTKGKFDVPPPVCVKPTCMKFKQFTNGLILPSYNGAVMNFYCKPGFTMRGSNISYCDGSKWSHNFPACISTHISTPTSCDFETEDLCGWSHDLNHDFDWRRQNFQTPSGHVGTGPRNDHTKGSQKDGYYMYVESTSRLENDTARLISPLYPPYRNGICFTFWYHMYGRDMGRLNIYIRGESQQGWGTKPLWTKQGNLGNIWRRGRLELDEGIAEEFQIIIEGIRGASYISDIAIDDVELTETCPDDEIFSSTTETTSESDIFGSCDNRCHENSSEIIFSDSASCECNDNCYERNTCCPDYFVICLQMMFDDYSTDSTENYDSTTEMETTTFLPPSTPIEINLPDTTVTYKMTPKPTKVVTKVTKIVTTQATKARVLTTKTIKTTVPTIQTKTPTTTDVSTLPPFQTDPITPNQIIEIETDYRITTEKLVQENPEILMQKDKIVENSDDLTFVIGGTSGAIVICAIVVIIIFVKYNTRCNRLRMRNSRNGDSMSDVRFLASDEVLDFTWRGASDL